MARKEGRSMQAVSAAGHGRAYQIRQRPRQIARDQRVDLTLATMELEGLELR